MSTLTIIRAANLLQRDGTFTGKSDPFVKVFQNGEQIHRTKTVDDKLNPVWAEGSEIVAIDATLPVYLEVWEDDTLSGHDFMGCATLLPITVHLSQEGQSTFLDVKLTPWQDGEERNRTTTSPLCIQDSDSLGELVIKIKRAEAAATLSQSPMEEEEEEVTVQRHASTRKEAEGERGDSKHFQAQVLSTQEEAAQGSGGGTKSEEVASTGEIEGNDDGTTDTPEVEELVDPLKLLSAASTTRQEDAVQIVEQDPRTVKECGDQQKEDNGDDKGKGEEKYEDVPQVQLNENDSVAAEAEGGESGKVEQPAGVLPPQLPPHPVEQPSASHPRSNTADSPAPSSTQNAESAGQSPGVITFLSSEDAGGVSLGASISSTFRRGSTRRRQDERMAGAKAALLRFFRYVLLRVRARNLRLDCAAIGIQKTYRGHAVYHKYLRVRTDLLVRRACAMHFCKLHTLPLKYRLHAAATRIQLLLRRAIAKNAYGHRVLVISAGKIQNAYRHHIWRRRSAAYTELAVLRAVHNRMATRIQAVYRGHLTRLWIEVNRQKLLRSHATNFTLTERERREIRLEKEARVENRRITIAMEKKAEKELLEMIFTVSDPNKTIVRWSTEQTYAAEFKRQQNLLLLQNNSSSSRGTGSAILAKGSNKKGSGMDSFHGKNSAVGGGRSKLGGANVPLPPGGSPAEPFVPQVMILEPSERATIATEPTTETVAKRGGHHQPRKSGSYFNGGAASQLLRANRQKKVTQRVPDWNVKSPPRAIKGGARAASNLAAKEVRGGSSSPQKRSRLPILDGTSKFDTFSPQRGHHTSHTSIQPKPVVSKSLRAVRLRAELEAVRVMDRQMSLVLDSAENGPMNYALRGESTSPQCTRGKPKTSHKKPPASTPVLDDALLLCVQNAVRQRMAVALVEEFRRQQQEGQGTLELNGGAEKPEDGAVLCIQNVIRKQEALEAVQRRKEQRRKDRGEEGQN